MKPMDIIENDQFKIKRLNEKIIELFTSKNIKIMINKDDEII